MLREQVGRSGSDWVTVPAFSTGPWLETRSLPLPVLTPSSRNKEFKWTGA